MSADNVDFAQGGSFLQVDLPEGIDQTDPLPEALRAHDYYETELLLKRSNQGLTLGNYPVTYTSYAGVDIVAQMLLPGEAPVIMGELQTISYSLHRENSPVRILGHSAPLGFVKGSRTISGSMIFTVFNNYAFYRMEHFKNAISNNIYPVADMLPPIDIVLTFSNEFGTFSKMRLLGLTFVDEGGVMSIDDLMTESTFTFMARGIQPLTGYYQPSQETEV